MIRKIEISYNFHDGSSSTIYKSEEETNMSDMDVMNELASAKFYFIRRDDRIVMLNRQFVTQIIIKEVEK